MIDLLNGEHFDDILQDTPDELRPGSIVVFYRSQDDKCWDAFQEMNLIYTAENQLPARERLMVAKYDIDMQNRLLTAFSPEQHLPNRVGIKEEECPSVVYVPRKCDGHTDWCEEDSKFQHNSWVSPTQKQLK